MTKTNKAEPVSTETPDLLAQRAEWLMEVFPDAVTEGKVDFERLRAALGEELDEGPERYSFTWAGKRDAIRILQMPSRATLVPVPEESINFDTTSNLFIEGDNLEVMKLLYKSYFGRVKMIYIDPPYNTGNDFIYSDNFVDPLDTYLRLTGQKGGDGNLLTTNPETSGRYHSAWLSLMYPRLFVARQLLSEEGLICVSIDDNEAYHLRMIMNEVFGEENFIAQLVWNTEGHTDNQYDVKVNHEYVVLYARNAAAISLGYIVDPNTRDESNLWKGFAENSITKNGPGNPPSEIALPVGFPCAADAMDLPPSDITSEFFSAVAGQGYISREITMKFEATYPIRRDEMLCHRGRLTKECRVYSGWANVNKLKTFIGGGCKPIRNDEGDTLTFYLSGRGVIYYKKDREKARHILSVMRNVGTTEQMRSELERLGIVFQYPKPKELLKYLAQIGTHGSGIVLDFFAGSCTMAQAILELNREDEGNRRFIMVQLPEPALTKESPTIAEIGKERIRRIIQTMRSAKEGKLDVRTRDTPEDLGFRVFKLTESNFRSWTGLEEADPEAYSAQMELYNEPLVVNWQPDSLLWEITAKEGVGLNGLVELVDGAEKNRVHRITDPETAQCIHICLDDKVDPDTPRALGLSKDDLFICRDAALDDDLAANLALQCRLKTI